MWFYIDLDDVALVRYNVSFNVVYSLCQSMFTMKLVYDDRCGLLCFGIFGIIPVINLMY